MIIMGNELVQYKALAEEMFFHGLKIDRLERIGRLKKGKTFVDLEEAYSRGLRKGGFPMKYKLVMLQKN